MNSVFLLAVGGIALLGIGMFLFYVVRLDSLEESESTPMYRTRVSVMNRSEQAFYFELKRQLPEGYYVFPNMRIADFIDAVDGQGFYRRRNHILPKHIDFLVCNPHFKPVLAIEVNGKSHLRPDRVDRDELVRQIFANAKLPLEFVNVGTNFIEATERIKKQLLVTVEKD